MNVRKGHKKVYKIRTKKIKVTKKYRKQNKNKNKNIT